MSLHSNFPTQSLGVPLRELQATDNFLVICIRLWAQENAYGAAAGTGPDWRGGFKAVGLNTSAQQCFNALLGVIFSTGKPTPSVNYYACPIAGYDEHWLLACVTFAQSESWNSLEYALRERLTACNRRLALPLIRCFSATMLKADLHLSRSNTAFHDSRDDIRRSVSLHYVSQKLH